MEIANKTVLITGASRGIGRAFVDALLERGAAQVYATTRTPGTLRGITDRRVLTLGLDVTSEAQITAAAERIGRLDVLINNAGVFVPDDLLAGDLGLLQRHLDVNCFGPLEVTRAFLPQLVQASGAVINVLSLTALANVPVQPSYSISKAAAFSMTQALRALLERKRVSVHAVFPGPVDTDMVRELDIPKASAASVAAAILDAVEAGQEDIFPDPMSLPLHEGWRLSPTKVLERTFAAFAAGGAEL